MNVALMKTKAELALGEQFAAAAARLPGDAWMRRLRAEAMGAFAGLGLPHRRIEEWKFTDLRERLKEAPEPAVADDTALSPAKLEAALGPLAALSGPRLVFVNGGYRPGLSRREGLAAFAGGGDADGVAQPLGAALRAGRAGRSARLEALFAGEREGDWARAGVLAILNAAFVSDGALITVAPGAQPAQPLHLVFVSAGPAARSVSVRNALDVGAGAEVAVLETFIAVGGAAHHTNSVTQVRLSEGAKASHVKCVWASHSAAHLSTFDVAVASEAVYRGFELTADVGLARNQLFVSFDGEGADVDLSGVLLGRGTEHIDTTLVVDHAVPRGTSRELFKAVLDDRARGVFQGKVIVRPGAQKSDGKQMAQGLMLSPDAEFDSKPELEIYADDVACGHGSTCAEIDPDLVFYLRSRGIPEPQARALLVEAFVGEVMDKIEHEPVREALAALAGSWLARGAAAGGKTDEP